MTEKKATPKKSTTKKKTALPKNIKISDSEKQTFPYSMFPVKLIHMDGKDMQDRKICYFQSEDHAKKYIDRCKFKKADYQMFVKNNG
jgi:hypothetical protein